MEKQIYITDLERIKRRLVDRYTNLKKNDVFASKCDDDIWLEFATKTRFNCDVKVNNWVEEQEDLDYIRHRRHPLNCFDHVYKTEYNSKIGHDQTLIRCASVEREPHAYPGHQPELDPPSVKAAYSCYETTASAAYKDPRLVEQQAISDPHCEICEKKLRELHRTDQL